nr:hypothetical protein GCM10020185_48980 [Pseudomonas brassicacearum subsp. brassicacearum]
MAASVHWRGALAGAAIGHDNRGKGALIGAAVVGASAAGYGYYADQQEKKLRASMANTGVEVQRQGDQIKLIMPGNITFATDSANIASSFYQPLNNLANSLKEFNQNQIEIVGYTDSTGSRQHNMDLSQRRAQSVATYLTSQGVSGANLSARGAGPDNPVASNADVNGRAQKPSCRGQPQGHSRPAVPGTGTAGPDLPAIPITAGRQMKRGLWKQGPPFFYGCQFLSA